MDTQKIIKDAYPSSEKVYVPGKLFPIQVGMRKINLTDTVTIENGKRVHRPNAPVYVYDTSGPYTDPAVEVDINKGLPRLRESWIAARGDVERLDDITSQYGRARRDDPSLDAIRFKHTSLPYKAKPGHAITQMHYARKGIITAEMEYECKVDSANGAVLQFEQEKRTALPGAAGAFVMEMPPYHIPTLKGVMLRTWDRVRTFMFRAGKVIVVIVACLSFLNSMGTDGSFGNEDSEKSVLSEIGKTIVPVFEPMGIQEQNWPAAVGVFTGIFAKEAVVGTLNSLYDTLSVDEAAKTAAQAPEEATDEEGFSLSATVSEAFSVVGENLSGLTDAFSDPMGIRVDDLSDQAAAAEEQGVSLGTIDTIKTLFGSTSAVFAYLLMVLLYVPCVAAVAAIYREVGTKWTIFACAWTLALGYSAATIFYRVANFSAAPVYSTVCIIVALGILFGMYCWMKSMAKKDAGKGPKIIPIIPVA